MGHAPAGTSNTPQTIEPASIPQGNNIQSAIPALSQRPADSSSESQAVEPAKIPQEGWRAAQPAIPAMAQDAAVTGSMSQDSVLGSIAQERDDLPTDSAMDLVLTGPSSAPEAIPPYFGTQKDVGDSQLTSSAMYQASTGPSSIPQVTKSSVGQRESASEDVQPAGSAMNQPLVGSSSDLQMKQTQNVLQGSANEDGHAAEDETGPALADRSTVTHTIEPPADEQMDVGEENPSAQSMEPPADEQMDLNEENTHAASAIVGPSGDAHSMEPSVDPQKSPSNGSQHANPIEEQSTAGSSNDLNRKKSIQDADKNQNDSAEPVLPANGPALAAAISGIEVTPPKIEQQTGLVGDTQPHGESAIAAMSQAQYAINSNKPMFSTSEDGSGPRKTATQAVAPKKSQNAAAKAKAQRHGSPRWAESRLHMEAEIEKAYRIVIDALKRMQPGSVSFNAGASEVAGKLDVAYRWTAGLDNEVKLPNSHDSVATPAEKRITREWIKDCGVIMKRLQEMDGFFEEKTASSKTTSSTELDNAKNAAGRLLRMYSKFYGDGPEEVRREAPPKAEPLEQTAPTVESESTIYLKTNLPNILHDAQKIVYSAHIWHDKATEAGTFDAKELLKSPHRKWLGVMMTNYQSVFEEATGEERTNLAPLGGDDQLPAVKGVSTEWVKAQDIVGRMHGISKLLIALYEVYDDSKDEFLSKLVGLVCQVQQAFWALDQKGENPAILLKGLRDAADLRRSREAEKARRSANSMAFEKAQPATKPLPSARQREADLKRKAQMRASKGSRR